MAKSFVRRFSKYIMITITILVIAVFAIACLSPYVNPQFYFWSGFMSLAIPYLIITLVLLVLAWLILKPIIALVPLLALLAGYKQVNACFGWNFSNAFVQEKKEASLRVVSWNVQSFNGLTHNKKIKSIIRNDLAESIHNLNPDVVCLQEFNHFYNKGKEADNIGLFSSKYPFHFFSKDYQLHKGKYASGCIIFSKYKIINTGRQQFNKGNESLIWADIVFKNDTFRIYNTHLQSFQFKEADYNNLEKLKEQNNSLTASKNILRKMIPAFKRRGEQAIQVESILQTCNYKHIICGDFNDVPNSFVYHTIRGTRRDAFLEKSLGIGRTFISIAPTLRIDYILTDTAFQIQQFDLVDEGLSDHIMLVTDIGLNMP